MSANIAIRARDLVKTYGTKRALDGASVEFASGEIHVLLGRNGSGKTTLAKILAGIMMPDSGDLIAPEIVNGVLGPEFRRNLGFLFDASPHWEKLTGRENAWFYARALGLAPEASSSRIDSLFDQLSLREASDDPVGTYSFGMKRKLALVQALVHEPRTLILDEPSIGLDYASRITIYTLLRAHAARGLTVVIATNDIGEARYLAERVSLIDKGRILVTGAPADLINQLDRRVTIEIQLGAPIDANGVPRIPGVVGANLVEGKSSTSLQVLADARDEQKVVGSLLGFLAERNVTFTKIDVRRPDLGDVFLKYAGVQNNEAR